MALEIVELETLLTLHDRVGYWEVLNFEQQIEFDEGDLGLPGAIQVLEKVSEHSFRGEMINCIYRYAGEAGPDLPWPVTEQEGALLDFHVRLERSLSSLEKKLGRTYR